MSARMWIEASDGQYTLRSLEPTVSTGAAGATTTAFAGRFGIEIQPNSVLVSCIGEKVEGVDLSIDILDEAPDESSDGGRDWSDGWQVGVETTWRPASSLIRTVSDDSCALELRVDATREYRVLLLGRQADAGDDAQWLSEEHELLLWPSKAKSRRAATAGDEYPRWLTPGKVLGYMFVLAVAFWAILGPDVVAWMLVGGVLLLWCGSLTVAAFLVPPRPLPESSALVKRALWFIRAMWAAVIVGASAVYGAMAATDLSRYESYGDGYMASARELVLLPVTLTFMAFIIFVIWISVDFRRCGPKARGEAIERVLDACGALANELLPPMTPIARRSLRAWLHDLLMGATAPWFTFWLGIFSWMALLLTITVVAVSARY